MRLIDADLLMRSFQVDMCGSFTCHECPLLNDDGECGFEVFISDTPTVDAEPVRHGRWVQVICHEEFEDGFVDRVKECCSVCHAPNGRKTTNYCPDCGAKMDEVMNNENK